MSKILPNDIVWIVIFYYFNAIVIVLMWIYEYNHSVVQVWSQLSEIVNYFSSIDTKDFS